jgi:hypothetical protein
MQRERVHLFLRSVLQEPEKVFEHNTLYDLSNKYLLCHTDPPLPGCRFLWRC